jgi:predicted permease
MREILTALWRRFVHRRKWERDMDDELKFHIEARAADLRRRGVPEPEATRQARVEFGGVEGHKELCREASWPARTVDECTSNLRHALRSLAKHRGFAAVGVISLALVIGASLATFSLIDRLMLTTLDVRDPDALYQVGVMGPEGFKNSHSYVGFDRLRLNTDLFDAVAWSQGTREVEVNGAKNNFTVVFVSGSYFPLLGGQARLGRTFAEQDDRPGAANIAVLGYGAWQRFYGGSTSVLGQAVKVLGVPFQIVGVTPAGFKGTVLGDAPDVMIPLHGIMVFNKGLITGSGNMWLTAMVRLKQGVPLAAARAAFRDRTLEAGKEGRAKLGRLDAPLVPTLEDGSKGYSPVRDEFSKPLLVLMTLAGVVLLIACANLSTLLFVRGAGRIGEMSLRLALGATRGQLIRHWMTESVLIAAMGGLVGVLLARWIVDFLLVFVSESARRYLEYQTTGRVAGAAVGLTIAASIVFGVLPALRASQASPGWTLKEAQSSGVGRRKRLARSVLVFQVAASLALVAGAVLMVRTLRNLNSDSGGVARSEIVYASVRFPQYA